MSVWQDPGLLREYALHRGLYACMLYPHNPRKAESFRRVVGRLRLLTGLSQREIMSTLRSDYEAEYGD
jgi:hypothetical protein